MMAKPCTLCSGIYNTSAKNACCWCEDCQKALCEDCKTVHLSSELLKKHALVHIEEYKEPSETTLQSELQNDNSIVYLPPRNIKEIGLKLKLRFPVDQTDLTCGFTTTGGVILSDGGLLVCDYWGNQNVIEYTEFGVYFRDIPKRALEIVVIDDNRVAITTNNTVEVVNMKTSEVEMKQKFEHTTGLCFYDGKLYVCVQVRGIVVLDLKGEILDTIKVDTWNIKCIAINKDKIYITDDGRGEVYCYSMKGERLWKFNKKWILNEPKGIAVDNDRHVFVVGSKSNNLAVLSNDGLEHKVLLTVDNGLKCPVSLCYNQKRDELCISHTYGGISVYNTCTVEPEPDNDMYTIEKKKTGVCAIV